MLLTVGAAEQVTPAADSLQAAYVAGNTIAVTSADGAVALSAAADATDLLTLTRTFAGAGEALSISMATGTTGDAIEIDMLGTSSGFAIQVLSAGVQTMALDKAGNLSLGGTTAPAAPLTMRVALTTTKLATIGSAGTEMWTMYPRGLSMSAASGGTVQGVFFRGGFTSAGDGQTIFLGRGRVVPTDGAESDDVFTGAAGHMVGVTVRSSFNPSSGSGVYSGLLVRPTINGTGTGTATALVVAPLTNTLTGGTVNLLDVGPTTQDYATGFTSQLRLDSNGDMVRGTAAAATALATAASTNRVVSGARTVQTTDATVTTVASGAIASGTAVRVFAIVTARRSDVAGETATYVISAGGENIGGTTAIVGTVATVDSDEDVAGWNATIDFDDVTDSWRVRVTGEAAKTIQWTADVRVVAA